MDTNRVYLTGLSMGGYGTWKLGLAHPERFAALVPICGGGNMIDAILGPRDKAARRSRACQSGRFTARKMTSFRLMNPERMVQTQEKSAARK